MADQTPHGLANRLDEPDVSAEFTAQPTNAATRMRKVAMPMLGPMAAGGHTADAGATLAAGVHLKLDPSAFTAPRDFVTPTACPMGWRVAVELSAVNGAGHAARVLTQAGQSIHGTAYNAAPFVELRALGDLVALRCVKADLEFVVDAAYLGHPAGYLSIEGGKEMLAGAGIGGKWIEKASSATPWAPAPMPDGNLVILTGTTTQPIDPMTADGMLEIIVPAAPNGPTVTLSGYKVLDGSAQDTGKDCLLVLRRGFDGTNTYNLAAWGAFA